MSKYHSVALPKTPAGDTYITAQMREDDPEIDALFRRTRQAWNPLGPNRDVWILRKDIRTDIK